MRTQIKNQVLNLYWDYKIGFEEEKLALVEFKNSEIIRSLFIEVNKKMLENRCFIKYLQNFNSEIWNISSEVANAISANTKFPYIITRMRK